MNELLAYLSRPDRFAGASGRRVVRGPALAAPVYPGRLRTGRPVRGAVASARGNGKTALLSGIAAATLDGPLGRAAGRNRDRRKLV